VFDQARSKEMEMKMGRRAHATTATANDVEEPMTQNQANFSDGCCTEESVSEGGK
jgi:hypothetical protein